MKLVLSPIISIYHKYTNARSQASASGTVQIPLPTTKTHIPINILAHKQHRHTISYSVIPSYMTMNLLTY